MRNILALLLVLFMATASYAADIECDDDSNGAVDINCGGTNSAAGTPTFTSITSEEFISTAADGDRRATLPNNTSIAPAGSSQVDIYNELGEVKVVEDNTEYDVLNSGDTLQSSIRIVSDADGYNMTIADNASIILMTGAGEVGAWDCSTANIGSWFEVWVRDASEQVQIVDYGDTSNDLFVIKNGTALDVNDEVDLATTANKRYTFICLEENKWYIAAEDATSTDGGAAD